MQVDAGIWWLEHVCRLEPMQVDHSNRWVLVALTRQPAYTTNVLALRCMSVNLCAVSLFEREKRTMHARRSQGRGVHRGSGTHGRLAHAVCLSARVSALADAKST